MDKPFSNLSQYTLDGIMAGEDLILRTVIKNRHVRQFPKEVAMLQYTFDIAYYNFNKKIRKLEKEQDSKTEFTDEEKVIIVKTEKEKEGRR